MLISSSWNKTLLFFVLILLALPSKLFCQIEQPQRLELDLGETEYEVLSANENGLFLLGKTVDLAAQEQKWNVLKLDTSFNVQWQRYYSVPMSQALVSKYSENGKLYFLFSRTEPRDRNLEVISFDQFNGSAKSYVIKNFIPIDFFDFKVNASAAIIAGYYNYRPIVIMYNLNEGIPIVLPGLFGDRNELIQLTSNQNRTFDVLISGRNIERQGTLFVNTYDFEGKLVNSMELNPLEGKSLIFGRSTSLSSNNKVVAGVYGRKLSEYSRGLFLANVSEDGSQSLKYYNYADLKNFFNYMRARREKRVRERIERRRIADKKIRFTYRLLVHDLIDDGDQYILLGEAFYPKYRNVGTDYRGPGRIVQSTSRGFVDYNRVFEGYRYTHAILIGFDKNGKLLWDNSFEINDVLSFDLEQFVHASILPDKTALLYVFENSIRSKVINKGDVLEGKELTPIALKYENDIANPGMTDVMGLESWYDNVFYTYGTQQIKNLNTEGVALNRDVFFINKVIYK